MQTRGARTQRWRGTFAGAAEQVIVAKVALFCEREFDLPTGRAIVTD
jgi:hypothetical protein